MLKEDSLWEQQVTILLTTEIFSYTHSYGSICCSIFTQGQIPICCSRKRVELARKYKVTLFFLASFIPIFFLVLCIGTKFRVFLRFFYATTFHGFSEHAGDEDGEGWGLGILFFFLWTIAVFLGSLLFAWIVFVQYLRPSIVRKYVKKD